ncbi:pro-opiomelanocortin-like [Antennarius striatus]|uniref:pro-opiomelanocortin-like n=1 Tax=Antennarius striatus TaxID=241820 RepID=UPI0035B16FBC
MVLLSTAFVVVMSYMCAPGFGCSDGSDCDDIRHKERPLDSIHFRKSVIQPEFPDVNALLLKVMDDEDFLLSIVVIKRLPANKILESFLESHNNQRRSYAMEHFRWGKPYGRKRRPVKVFASSQDGGGSVKGMFPPQARRQLNSHEDDAREDPNRESHQNQGSLTTRLSSKSHVQLIPQQRKHGSYQIRHFRWGRPSVSKRNGNIMRTLTDRQLRQMNKRLDKILAKDLQRITGRIQDKKGEGQVIESV